MSNKRLIKKTSNYKYLCYIVVPIENNYIKNKNHNHYLENISKKDIVDFLKKYSDDYQGKNFIAIKDKDYGIYAISNGESVQDEVVNVLPDMFQVTNKNYNGTGDELNDLFKDYSEPKTIPSVWLEISYELIKSVFGTLVDEMINKIKEKIKTNTL